MTRRRSGRYTSGLDVVPSSVGEVEEVARGLREATRPSHPEHRGGLVAVGKYTIAAGGTKDLQPEDMKGYDVIVPLVEARQMPPHLLQAIPFGTTIYWASLPDYGGVDPGWKDFLTGKVIPDLKAGKKILTFCMGSHGRTGTILASLIAIVEGAISTPDPIGTARNRHCHKAVETRQQAEAVFALRSATLLSKYDEEWPNLNDGRYGSPSGYQTFQYREPWSLDGRRF
jgi:hypothetical protein